DVGARGENVIHFLTQTGEIGGENRRSNSEGLHDAPFLSRITMARIVYLMLSNAHCDLDDLVRGAIDFLDIDSAQFARIVAHQTLDPRCLHSHGRYRLLRHPE